jgi:hypothetical protein
MRRTETALVIIVLVLAIGTPAASADTVVVRVDTGTFAGTSTYEFGVPACPFIHQVFTGSYDPDRRTVRGGTYVVDVCVDQPNANFEWPFNGTFEIVTGHGFSLRGSVTGAQIPNDNSGPIVATLTVTESPGLRHPLRGTITIDGITDQSFPAPPGTSVEEGTFAADLHRSY